MEMAINNIDSTAQHSTAHAASCSESPIVKIIIACHKKCDVPSDSIYFPVHVGAEGKEPIGFTPDNTGDNISTQNNMISELTGLYWAWKNLPCDYIGLVHYSRYFAMRPKFGTSSVNAALTCEQIMQLISSHKIILPKRRKYYIETMYSHYAHTADSTHLDITREVISLKCPEYLKSFDEVMGRTWGHIFNMFIMSRLLADAYCEWLFPILFELEGRIDMSNKSVFDSRRIGSIAEHMLDVWLGRQLEIGNIKREDIHEVPYIYTRKINWFKKATGFLMAKFFHRKYTKSF